MVYHELYLHTSRYFLIEIFALLKWGGVIWNSNSLATWCKELTHWKRLWCWERLKAGGEGDDRGWDGWMASPTWWTWVWVNSGSWWWTGRPGVLQSMGSQRVRHDWVTELNWTEIICSNNEISVSQELNIRKQNNFFVCPKQMNMKQHSLSVPL